MADMDPGGGAPAILRNFRHGLSVHGAIISKLL
jgi:hypothetical protein